MSFSTAHALWETRELDRHLEGDKEYDFDMYRGLPCEYVESLDRWRDVETGLFVPMRKAVELNNAECEAQDDHRNRVWDRD